MKINNKLEALRSHITDMCEFYNDAETYLKMAQEDSSVFDTSILLEDYFKEVNESYCKMEKNGSIFSPNGDLCSPGCDTYSRYPDGNCVDIAHRLRSLNDKLLAFKYCYDRYSLSLNNDRDTAFCVCFDHEEDCFTYIMHDHCKCNTVYFSTEDVAKKCCAWLNFQLAEDAIYDAARYMLDSYEMLTGD